MLSYLHFCRPKLKRETYLSAEMIAVTIISQHFSTTAKWKLRWSTHFPKSYFLILLSTMALGYRRSEGTRDMIVSNSADIRMLTKTFLYKGSYQRLKGWYCSESEDKNDDTKGSFCEKWSFHETQQFQWKYGNRRYFETGNLEWDFVRN